jgi:Mn2+/Fe2+ NRAMP family transporter
VIILVLMRITNDRRLMGEHANGLGTNAVMVLVIVVALYLTYKNAVALWGGLMTYI